MSFGIGFFQRDFNPLRPCGRRHLPFATSPPHLNFNPLRPCGRRPVPLPARFAISCYFNPLRPCGRRPLEAANKRLIGAISIHSARVGGDLTCTLGWLASRYFNPLRPCGRRPIAFQVFLMIFGFQSTPPVWAETCNAITRIIMLAYFNPLRPCGRRLQDGEFRRTRIRDFNPLRPCGRRQQKKPFFRLLSISITTYFTEKSKRTRCKFSHLGYLFQYSLLILVRTSLYVDV